MKRYRFKRIIVTEMWADIYEETAEEAFETVNRKYEADNDEDRRELEHCIPKRKYICNPIVDWSDELVWRFIVEDNLPYCDLYDKGFNRLGCIGCPMSQNRNKELNMYPKYKEQYLRTFDKMLETRRRKGLKTSWKNAQEVYDWWISG